MLLVGFSVVVIILVVSVKRTATLLLSLAGVLCLFGFLSFLSPDPDKSLHLSLNLSHLGPEKVELVRTAVYEQEEAAPLSGLFPPEIAAQRYAPSAYRADTWSLKYGLIRSTSREIPLSAFTAAASVKFDQLPKIERIEGRYVLKYVNPLRYWSLHEPD
jgi:hypothetical protein